MTCVYCGACPYCVEAGGTNLTFPFLNVVGIGPRGAFDDYWYYCKRHGTKWSDVYGRTPYDFGDPCRDPLFQRLVETEADWEANEARLASFRRVTSCTCRQCRCACCGCGKCRDSDDGHRSSSYLEGWLLGVDTVDGGLNAAGLSAIREPDANRDFLEGFLCGTHDQAASARYGLEDALSPWHRIEVQLDDGNTLGSDD